MAGKPFFHNLGIRPRKIKSNPAKCCRDSDILWIGLGEIYRKAPYLMGKSMVSCRFSLKPIHWDICWMGFQFPMTWFFQKTNLWQPCISGHDLSENPADLPSQFWMGRLKNHQSIYIYTYIHTYIYICIYIYIYIWLVVPTPLKNMKVSWDDDIPIYYGK